MSTFETEAAFFAAQTKAALRRISVYLRFSGDDGPVVEAARAAFADPATMLASLDGLGEPELAALLAEAERTEGCAAIDGTIRLRIGAGDRRTIEALELFARRNERHGDYVRLLAQTVALVGDSPLGADLRKLWSKSLHAAELRDGACPEIKFSSVVVHAIESELERRRREA